MSFTDLFIRRPVLATVVSLLILLLGLQGIVKLSIRQYPKIEDTQITVATAYPGAAAQLMQGFVTTPLQQSIAGAAGIDYLTSSSTTGLSSIVAHLRVGADPDKAMTEVMSKVAGTRRQLPKEAEDPVITKAAAQQIDLLYITFYSETMTPERITDYLTRVVQPKLATVDGVAQAEILGQQSFAMRIWLDPIRMAALRVTANDVADAIRRNNYQSAPGQTKGSFDAVNLNAKTGLSSPEEFGQLVVRSDGAALVRLRDIAKVELGAENLDTSVVFDGQPAVALGIQGTPEANPLTVIDDVLKVLPDIQATLPAGLNAKVAYDSTRYIRASIREVIVTIAEAAGIVVLVIFLFLGAFRSVVIPLVTIPLSLVGVCSLLLVLGYSLNLLTLLAMVLAIGLVVDDAIVVVENIHRHIEEGLSPVEAARKGAREIALPVIAMTITLAAVYAPIGFTGGLTGALFKEFAFTLAGAVIVSGIIALTLSPMMCSRLLSRELSQNRFVRFLDRSFERTRRFYERRLASALKYRPVVVMVAIVVLAMIPFLYVKSFKALAPEEDQGVVFLTATASQSANFDYLTAFTRELDTIFGQIPERQDYFLINGLGKPNNAIAGLLLKTWQERERSQKQIQQQVQAGLARLAGLQAFAFALPTLPGSGGGLPVQFVVSSTASHREVVTALQALLLEARKSGLFIVADVDLKLNKPEVVVEIDRSKAAALGIGMADIGASLGGLLSGDYVNRFDIEGRSYKVIPQVPRRYRLDASAIDGIYVKTAGNGMVPLSSVVTLVPTVQPNSLTQFNQLNSGTLQGIPIPGTTLGQVLEFLNAKAKDVLPKGFNVDYMGELRQLVQEGNALLFAFIFAVVVIYLVLAAQFESFRDPLIILVSVPMSICGALIPLNLGITTINIFTQIGLVTLIGLISKHGILMVDFANHLQLEEGLDRHQAILKAAGIRLRPILMTTAAMVVGVIPLMLATGAGAASRFNIGLVIATGMSIGTVFTLFVVPTVYTYVARERTRSGALAVSVVKAKPAHAAE
ncbi:MAG: efflux RND transporter permease subunit [Proteobacteria bacterium]|nr:efflux RND transporter permease subunit [Pseudomonadota bacterium]